jgi:predicted ArsR family transcriptional regulator
MSGHTRESILAYLHKYHTATTAELSDAFHFTKENIRHHLNLLQEEGFIELIPEKPVDKNQPGRPSLVYHINSANQTGNMFQLATTLLQIYLENLPSTQEKQAGLKKLAQALFPSQNQNQKPAQVYNKSIQRLNQHGYQARWEAHLGGPLFSFRNCPYAAAQLDQPELCQLDAYILENLLGSPVIQMAKINLNGKNPPACIFSLNVLLA